MGLNLRTSPLKPAPRFCSNIDRQSRTAAFTAVFFALLMLLALLAGQAGHAGGFSPRDPGVQTNSVPAEPRSGSVASLIEGVWRAADGSQLFFGRLDPATGTGPCIATTPRQNQPYHHTYRIQKTNEATRTILIEIVFAGGPMPPSAQELTLSPDGRTAQRRILGAGFSWLQFIRLDPDRSDTLVYVSRTPA